VKWCAQIENYETCDSRFIGGTEDVDDNILVGGIVWIRRELSCPMPVGYISYVIDTLH